MRDAKLLFHNGVAPTVASGVVDSNSSEPGVGTPAFYSATITNHTAAANVFVNIEGSDTATGTFTNVATFTIPSGRAALGNVILSTPLPSNAKRFLRTTWTGLTGGVLTDGLDWGLKEGSAATRPYLA